MFSHNIIDDYIHSNNTLNKDATLPIIDMIMKRSINDIMNPAIAKPRGEKNKPIKERTKPKNQIIQPAIGTHPRSTPKMANTKPDIARPFVPEPLLITITLVPVTLVSVMFEFCCRGDVGIILSLTDVGQPHWGHSFIP